VNWNLADAKNRLSEVLSKASKDGPQTIRRRSEDFVVLSKAKYEKLVGKQPTFTDWLLSGPPIDRLDLPPRDRSPMRRVEL